MVGPSLRGRLLMLTFQNEANRREMRCQLFSFNCGNKRLQLYDRWMELFDQPVNGNIRGYDNIRNISLVSWDKYKTDCLLDYTYFQEKNKLNAKDLSKQENLMQIRKPYSK